MLRRIHALPLAPFQATGLFPGDTGAATMRSRLEEAFGHAVARLGNRPDTAAWVFALTPETVAQQALAALPDSDLRAAHHSNPGLPHTFVHPGTGADTGLIDFGDSYINHSRPKRSDSGPYASVASP